MKRHLLRRQRPPQQLQRPLLPQLFLPRPDPLQARRRLEPAARPLTPITVTRSSGTGSRGRKLSPGRREVNRVRKIAKVSLSSIFTTFLVKVRAEKCYLVFPLLIVSAYFTYCNIYYRSRIIDGKSYGWIVKSHYVKMLLKRKEKFIIIRHRIVWTQ